MVVKKSPLPILSSERATTVTVPCCRISVCIWLIVASEPSTMHGYGLPVTSCWRGLTTIGARAGPSRRASYSGSEASSTSCIRPTRLRRKGLAGGHRGREGAPDPLVVVKDVRVDPHDGEGGGERVRDGEVRVEDEGAPVQRIRPVHEAARVDDDLDAVEERRLQARQRRVQPHPRKERVVQRRGDALDDAVEVARPPGEVVRQQPRRGLQARLLLRHQHASQPLHRCAARQQERRRRVRGEAADQSPVRGVDGEVEGTERAERKGGRVAHLRRQRDDVRQPRTGEALSSSSRVGVRDIHTEDVVGEGLGASQRQPLAQRHGQREHQAEPE
mmetsp:Transcript_28893/g.85265  ORF Transcript_28893/g.85265 Transcript_28893/m.85265 type:complete len:331 (+) Transcript_28893:430-1422(+)